MWRRTADTWRTPECFRDFACTQCTAYDLFITLYTSRWGSTGTVPLLTGSSNITLAGVRCCLQRGACGKSVGRMKEKEEESQDPCAHYSRNTDEIRLCITQLLFIYTEAKPSGKLHFSIVHFKCNSPISCISGAVLKRVMTGVQISQSTNRWRPVGIWQINWKVSQVTFRSGRKWRMHILIHWKTKTSPLPSGRTRKFFMVQIFPSEHWLLEITNVVWSCCCCFSLFFFKCLGF